MRNLFILPLLLLLSYALAQPVVTPPAFRPVCPYPTTNGDGCTGAQANGFIIDAHMADVGKVIDLSIDGGNGFINGTYTWVGTGGGCVTQPQGTITVIGGFLGGNVFSNNLGSLFTIVESGSGCTSRPTIAIPSGAGAGSGGPILTLGTITPGSGGTAGTYNGVALTGGSGSGAIANITVSGGGVTSIALFGVGTSLGTGYLNTDVLSASSASIGNTTGFSVPVATITPGGITATVYQQTPHNSQANIGYNWNVAGVDYPVGYDTSLVLKNPRTQGPACTSFDGNHTLTVNSSNCTVNGFDFGFGGVYTQLNVASNLTGIVVTNNRFVCTAAGDVIGTFVTQSGSTDLTIKYNVFDGGAAPGGVPCRPGGQSSMLNWGASTGSIVIEYNYCFHADSKCFNSSGGIANTSTNITVVEKYNLIIDIGICGDSCEHGEAEYGFTPGYPASITWTQNFNVYLQHYFAQPTNLTAIQALQTDGWILNNADNENNFVLTRGTGFYNHFNATDQVAGAAVYCGTSDHGFLTGTSTMINNIIDYSGAFFPVNGSDLTCGSFGSLFSLGTVTGGSGGTDGTYNNVALTGGSGRLGVANITVSGGAVTNVYIMQNGGEYLVGDTLSAASGNIGGVTGFSVPVTQTFDGFTTITDWNAGTGNACNQSNCP